MRKIYTILASALISLTTITVTSAQGVNFGGVNFDNDIISWSDLYNLSFTSHNYGTARSMAMGNAFTALGADMVSASLNPAGIGMYVMDKNGAHNGNNVSLSLMMQFTKSPTKNSDPFYIGVPKKEQDFKDHTERFGMSSAGGVFSVFRSTGTLTNLNLGLVYNRIADFNQNMLNASYGNAATESMANVFCTLANVDGLQTTEEGKMYFGNDPYYWGPVAAYKNGLLNHDEQGWFIDRISPDATIDQFSSVETRGCIGEYALTFGMNFIDRIYVGASIGMQDVRYRRNVFYGEDYIYADGQYPSGEEYPYQLEYMDYLQRTNISGSGINFKIGITALPLEWLRIGVAYHSPTWYNVSMRYDLEMWSRTYSAGNNPDNYLIGPNKYMYDNVYSGIWEDAGPNSWRFRSPSRLLLGAAATIAKRVIISADYERSWYQSTRLTGSSIAGLSYTSTMKEIFKGGSTVRVGAEVYVLPFLPVRAGYIWSGSTLREDYEDIIAGHQMPTEQSIVSAGFGLQLNKIVYLDFAYQYSTTNYSSHQTFYAIDSLYPEMDIESRLFSTKTKRHMAIVTVGFRF